MYGMNSIYCGHVWYIVSDGGMLDRGVSLDGGDIG